MQEVKMTPSEIAKEAVKIMNKRITNEIFTIIQNDPKLMQEYLRAVEDKGLDAVNQTIGKRVKTSYKLTNMDYRENKPSCTLIQSYQLFK
jgi:hypothetical protein